MNVACTACPAKYSVPDEKVRGKKVKITCKHCGTGIVVDGTGLGAGPAPKDALTSLGPVLTAPAEAAPVIVPPTAEPAPPAATAPPGETAWMVGFADDHQEQHTMAELVSLYKAGKIDDDCFIWRDGMSDWLAPFDVPEVAEALRKAGLSPRGQPLPADEEDEATRVAPSPFDMEHELPAPPLAAPAPAPAPAPSPAPAPAAALKAPMAEAKPAAAKPAAAALPKPAAAALPKPAAEAPRAAAQIKPAAARRNPERGAIDLFGAVDTAGTEDDAPVVGDAGDDGQKLTGQRNESSVLFSLDALAKIEKPKPQDKKKDDRAAAAELFGDSGPSSLMNMGGGGLGILAAPDFTKPAAPAPEPVRVVSEAQAAAPARGGSMWVGIGIGVVVALAAGGAILFTMGKKDSDKPGTASSASAATSGKPEETAAAPAPPPASAAAATATASAEPAAAASAASSASATAAKPAAGAAPAAGTPAKPGDAKKPDAPAAAAPAGGGGEFDRGAAVASLGAAAANAASCRKAEGPFGSGKASVTFAPSGRATQANISGTFAGTEVGGCVARIFRAAKVPPFSGDAVTVSKSFSIE